MRFELDLSGAVFGELPLDTKTESVVEVLFQLGLALEKAPGVRFVVGGFGQDRWPMQIGRDLSLFLETIPEALASLESGAAFRIDFPGQGMLRWIDFAPSQEAGSLSATCTSGDDWNPSPISESIERDRLRSMLLRIRSEVAAALRRNSPKAAAHPAFIEWARTPR